MENKGVSPALWTKDFILAFVSNLMLFFSFYMLVPVLPFYVIDHLGATESMAGLVLSLYTIAALLIRPFSGFLVDSFKRKPLYLLCYAFFSIIFAGYTVTTTLLLFIVLRSLHGFGFGISTVSGSTLAVDIMPSQRRGEGIGYFGMAANIAMAVGPVLGLWLYAHYTFIVIFLGAFFASLIGFIAILGISPIKEQPVVPGNKALSWDRFILLRAVPCAILLFLEGFGYGAISNFIGLYCEQSGFTGMAGVFFIFLSLGIICARLLSAKTINNGKVIKAIYIGTAIIVVAFGLFIFCRNDIMLLTVALMIGLGFGYINPAFQSMFINLAEHSQRGTANATYFSFWDMGIGIGVAAGGVLIDKLSFEWLFAVSAGLVILGVIWFSTISVGYFRKYRLR